MSTPLTVTEITNKIKNLLTTGIGTVRIRGEITNIKVQQPSGHIYFSLKDDQSQIACVFFKFRQLSLKSIPQAGDKVVLDGEISVYNPRGTYQIDVKNLQKEGLGDLLLRFQQLKQALEAKGYFAQERKKPLPKNPKRLVVITSPTGAVIQDILNILKRRCKGFHLILYPVKVQGEGASKEIAKAIKECNDFSIGDLIILGRGGGSLEDLWAFNEESVADAIFSSVIPIISAVGHETDFTIADFVADKRAPTPSAAAEIALGESQVIEEKLASIIKRIDLHIVQEIRKASSSLKLIQKHPLFIAPHALVTERMQRLHDLEEALAHHMEGKLKERAKQLEALRKHPFFHNPKGYLTHQKTTLQHTTDRLDESLKRALQLYNHRLDGIKTSFSPNRLLQLLTHFHSKLHLYERSTHTQIEEKIKKYGQRLEHIRSILLALHPDQVLQKGYLLAFDSKGSVVTSAAHLELDQLLTLSFHDGKASVRVDEIALSLEHSAIDSTQEPPLE